MIPDSGEGVIDLRMVEDVVGPVTVEVIFRQRNPVNRKADMVPDCNIGIDASVVLGRVKCGGIDSVVVRNVRHRTETAADPGVTRTGPGKIVRAQGRRQRRTNIDALAWNGPAIYPFRKAGSCAGGVRIEGSDHPVSGERKILCGDASRRRGPLRSFACW